MKKLTVVSTLALIMTVTSTVMAQTKMEIGLKGGWNFADLSGTSSLATASKNRSGYHAGVYTLIKVANIGIQPEVIFSQQGEIYSYSGSNYGTNINYVNIPVMAKFYLAEGVNLQVGPQIGFVTKATGSLKNLNTGAITTDQDVKDFLNTTDFAIAVGAGWDFAFGLSLTARYNIGISDINKYSGGSVPNNVSTSMGTTASKNNVFQFSLGYRIFDLGK